MAIHLPDYIPPSPIASPAKFKKYLVMERKAIKYLMAYEESLGIFSMFSLRKSRNLKEAESRYRIAVKDYLMENE
jgi:hypothetical protein